MSDKVFTTYDEQIHILTERGIKIETPTEKSYAKKRLQHEGYYNLINGYKKLFLIQPENPNYIEGKEQFFPGTTINEIYALYNFDRKLRNVFFKNILIFETNIKSLISYAFSKEHPEENYLVYTNFNTSLRNSEKNITNLISEIQKQIANRYQDPSISHYLKTYGNVPLWVLNNILTLGTISKFYSLMKENEQQDIAKIYHVTNSELKSSLFYISKVRNFCAHSNRLYCFRTTTPIATTPLHISMNLPIDSNGEYLLGKRDLFACVIALKRLLPKNLFKMFAKQIHHELNSLRTQLSVLSEADVLNAMGFPLTWYEDILK